MAVFDTSRGTMAPRTAGLAQLFSNAVAGLAAWNDARLTRKSLMQLTEHELDDIGLARSDIDTVARRTLR